MDLKRRAFGFTQYKMGSCDVRLSASTHLNTQKRSRILASVAQCDSEKYIACL